MSGSTQPVTQSWRAAEPRYAPHAVSYPVQIARPHAVRQEAFFPCPRGVGAAWHVTVIGAVTQKSGCFRACGMGFHHSSLMASSFVSPYGAFIFFSPFPASSWWCSWFSGSSLLSTQVHLSSWQEHPWLDGANSLEGKGEAVIHMEQEPPALFGMALNHRGMSIVSCVWPYHEPGPCSSHPWGSSPHFHTDCWG